MAHYEHLPIYKKAMDLAVYLEKLGKGFPRYHKYTLGTEMRNQSRTVVVLIIRAYSERDRSSTLETLRDEIERLKVTVRIANKVKAFRNFNSFTIAVEFTTRLLPAGMNVVIIGESGRSLGRIKERLPLVRFDMCAHPGRMPYATTRVVDDAM